jgi:uncharacterized protein YjbI with pentapeptide repeats
MPEQDLLDILSKGVRAWNNWQQYHQDEWLDLTQAKLHAANLREAELRWANLTGADLSGASLRKAYLAGAMMGITDLRDADLSEATMNGADLRAATMIKARLIKADLTTANMNWANLTEANLSNANLYEADLRDANLSWANLTGANLTGANLTGANLTAANLAGADLTEAILVGANLTETKLTRAKLVRTNMVQADLVGTKFKDAILEDCLIYGISAWDVKLDGTIQKNLNISPLGAPVITVDNLKVAQFIHLLLNNAEIRDVIDTLTGKAALILGSFAGERKDVLNALRDALRARNYVPILFDFTPPASRDLTETIVTLAHLSRFVIADLTSPSSIGHEVMSFTKTLSSVPVQPIILKEHKPFSMFLNAYQNYNWVLPLYEYDSQASLIQELNENIIQPAEQKAIEQSLRIQDRTFS